MKYRKRFLCAALAAMLLAGCSGRPADLGEGGGASPAPSSQASAPAASSAGDVVFTDALGYQVELHSWQRVVSLYGSFAETWVLAGGALAGTTSDAVEERGLQLGEEVAVVGSIKEPNLEEILAADPDFVILSADTAAQVDLHAALAEAGVPHAYYRVDAFDEYLAMLRQFCDMTGREDLYEENGLRVQQRVEAVLAAVEGRAHPTALLIRAFSTGAKAKGDDNLTGVMLRDLGAENLVSRHESLLEDVSMEEVIAADPDFIFVITMGSSEEKAMEYMRQNFEENPAWAGLTAVKNGRYVMLPKELFHYKPNARWGESYETLAKILYPDLAAQIG